jgi:hypothetical protein
MIPHQVVDRPGLTGVIHGPAIIEERESATVLDVSAVARVGERGDLIVDVQGRDPELGPWGAAR